MGGATQTAEMEQISLDLILCARQPGKLRISRNACALRYVLAQKENMAFPEDEFGMARKVGLDICKNCPEGRGRAEAVRRKELGGSPAAVL